MRKFGRTIFGGGISLPIIPVPITPPSSAVYTLTGAPSLSEGNSGTTNFTFTLVRSTNLTVASTVNWAVTATGANAADFVGGVFPSGQVSFGIGETSKDIIVAVQGDVTVETNEIFTVTVSNPEPAGTIVTATATGTIVNDDAAPPPPPPPSSAMVAPPQVNTDAFETGTLWAVDGLDNPTTTYSRRWLYGSTALATTPFSPNETGLSLTVPNIGGQYVRLEVTPANGEDVRYSDAVRIHHAVITAPVLTRTSASGASPFTYSIFYDNTVDPSDIERVQYATDINFTDILWDATRGLTEAAFTSPFISDDSADADPAWSTPPPTFTGTYFVRRKVIALHTLNNTPVESTWSNIESNFTIDLSVRIDAGASWMDPGNPSDKYTLTDGNLTFQNLTNDYRQHCVQVNYARSGDRTAELEFKEDPSTVAVWGFGFHDGSYDWSTPPSGGNNNTRMLGDNGWRGVFITANNSDIGGLKGNGTTTTYLAGLNAGQGITPWAINDKLRLRINPGTFNSGVPNDDATVQVWRVRGATKTLLHTYTGLPSMASYKAFGCAIFNKSGTFKFTGLTPAVESGSLEYQ